MRERKARSVLGISITPFTIGELHDYILDAVRNNSKRLILHVNIQGANLAYAHSWLRYFFNQADVVFCDGAGIRLAGRILGLHIPERITYADWMWQLAEFAATNGLTFFFLGSRPGVAELAAMRLRAKHPTLRIVGLHHGFFEKSVESPENQQVIHDINTLKPDILIVGFGMPLQERWLMENWDQIDARVALTGGAVFDYVSGELRRAPHWMTDHGLEWLGRLIIEPGRLWRRYIIGNPLFLWRVFKQKLGWDKYPD